MILFGSAVETEIYDLLIDNIFGVKAHKQIWRSFKSALIFLEYVVKKIEGKYAILFA